ncbi:tetratricopeptide repeat protein [Candidatus Peregrinibacteria bacterium]|nr:tetratricopeptide repeat protein [Candidatus Peregrinibacteria bacterium]
MIKKILTILNLLLTFTLVILTLYIFNIIDIPFLHKTSEPGETVLSPFGVTETEQTPEETGEKVERKKSYDELIKKGNLYYEKGFYNLAVDSYTQASNANPSKIEPLIRMGELQLILGNYEQTKLMGERIVKLNPQTVQGKIISAKANIGLEAFQEAKNIIDAVMSDEPEVAYLQGELALFTGEYERGRGLLNTVIQNNTNQNVTANAQKFIDAMNEFDTYSAGVHEHLKVLISKAYVLVDEPIMAKELLWNVVRTNREYRDAWIILGYSYLKIKKFQDAVDALTEAKRQDPENPQTLFYLGLAYAGADKTDEAIKELELAEKNGYEPKIHVEQKLAELYFQKEEYEKANNKYENVISLNPTDVDYFVRPLWVYIDKLNQPTKAVKLAEKALLHNPNDPMSFNLIGWAQVADNDFINAKKNLEKAIALNEKFNAPYLNLGWMFERQGNFNKAKEYYKKAYNLGTGDAVGDLAAQRYNALLLKENEHFMANIFN